MGVEFFAIAQSTQTVEHVPEKAGSVGSVVRLSISDGPQAAPNVTFLISPSMSRVCKKRTAEFEQLPTRPTGTKLNVSYQEQVATLQVHSSQILARYRFTKETYLLSNSFVSQIQAPQNSRKKTVTFLPQQIDDVSADVSPDR